MIIGLQGQNKNRQGLLTKRAISKLQLKKDSQIRRFARLYLKNEICRILQLN